jgi:hypothetical protein
MFFLSALTCHLRYAAIILCLIVVMILFSKWTGSVLPVAAAPVYVRSKKDARGREVALVKDLVARARSLTEACYATGHVEKSEKIEQLMQLAYGLSYLDTAQMLATDSHELQAAIHAENLPALVTSIQTLQAQLHASVA